MHRNNSLFLIAIAFTAFGCGIDLAPQAPPPGPTGPIAVLLDVDGAMPSFSSSPGLFASFATSQHKLESLLDRAAKDIMVQEVVVRFGAPQVGWARASEISDAIAKLAATGKSVSCHIDAADNLTYWMAARSCPRITVAPGGGIDLVGLSLDAVFLKEMLASMGVTADMLHIGRYKDAAEALTNTEMSPESREAADSMLSALHESLVAGIAAGRKKDFAAVAKIIDEGPYTAKGAVSAGLADGVETLFSQLEKLKDKYAGGVVDDYGKEPAKPFSLTELFTLFGGGEEKKAAAYPRIALIPAVGPIVSGGGGNDLLGGMEEVVDDLALSEALSEAARDSSVKAIVLRIDSPGGSALASDNLYEAVRAAARRKPVIASMGDVAASGGYYLAAAATEVLASESTLTGSIGVVGGKIVIGDGLGKLGVRVSSVERGRRASISSSFRPFSDEERVLVTAQMQEAYDLFIDRVAAGRSLPREKVLAAAEGRVWTGRQALGLKLVDRLGTLAAAIDRARELSGAKGVPAELYPAPRSFIEELGERFSQQDTSAFALARRTAVGRRALAMGGLLFDTRVLAFAPLTLEVR